MQSCIYRGKVRHHRRGPKPHRFQYRLFMMYLDLEELPQVFAKHRLWSFERRNLAAFHRSDYLGDPGVPLRDAVLDRAEASLGRRPMGPVRLLTQLRFFGFVMNPVTFYYCFDSDGETLDAIVAEITNTPWGERHAYVLDAIAAPDLRWRFDKRFHVSPFMDMEQSYDWRFSTPCNDLMVHMENWRDREHLFDATLTLERREIRGQELARTLLAHPFMTGKVALGIYWQAARLWWAKTPFHPHPRHADRASTDHAGAPK